MKIVEEYRGWKHRKTSNKNNKTIKRLQLKEEIRELGLNTFIEIIIWGVLI